MSIDGMGPVPAGWYRDPAGGGQERYFDGSGWTAEVRPVQLRRRPRAAAGVAVDAVPAAASTAAASPFGRLPSTPLPTSPLARRRGSQHTPARTPAPPGAAATPAAPSAMAGAGVRRRSLTDALGSTVNDRSAQQLLLGTATALPPRAMRTQPGPTPAGWYPDPARGGGLRFFDGSRWTSRTRPATDVAVRRLPAAALKLRARFLDAQDAAALRRGHRPRPTRLVIPQASSAPSLHTRTRSGSLWGMLSTLLMLVGFAAAVLFAWQLWGTDYQNVYQQRHLEETLAAQPATAWGDLPVVVETVPVPTAGAAPGAVPTTRPADLSPETRPGKAPRTDRPATGPRRPDTAPATGPVARPGTPRPDQVVPPTRTRQVRVAPNTDSDGRPVGHLRIPRLGLKRVFVLGTEEEQLALGPGLWKWGSFPGTPGNTTISGHRTTHGAPFRYLDKLRFGDKIIVDVPGMRRAVYEVRGTTIADPFDVRVTKQTAGVRLTLTTCHPVGSDAERMVVQAELVSGTYVAEALPRSQWRVLR